METNITIQPILSEKNPIPSVKKIPLVINQGYPTGVVTPLPKPFLILLDDKNLKPGTLFTSYKFLFSGAVFILKTIQNKFVVLARDSSASRGKYSLFSTKDDYYYEYDRITDLCTADGAFATHVAFSFSRKYKEYSPLSKTIKIYKIGEHGIRPQPTLFHPTICSDDRGDSDEFHVHISEVIGPFPLGKSSHGRWWVAICSDNLYRVFEYSRDLIKETQQFNWVMDQNNLKVATFRRFMPTLEPDWFYFLTAEGKEFITAANEYSGFNPIELSSDRIHSCIASWWYSSPNELFWSQDQHARGLQGNMEKVIQTLANPKSITW